jgi:hypothetical protein
MSSIYANYINLELKKFCQFAEPKPLCSGQDEILPTGLDSERGGGVEGGRNKLLRREFKCILPL